MELPFHLDSFSHQLSLCIKQVLKVPVPSGKKFV